MFYTWWLRKIEKVPKRSINEVLLATFHRQEQKVLGFWVVFMTLPLMLQLTLKQMMVNVKVLC